MLLLVVSTFHAYFNFGATKKIMKLKYTLPLLAVLGACALTANAQDNTPPADAPPAQHDGSGAPRGGFHVLPPPLVKQLNLTDDQKTQIAALEADTKAKLEKILTSDQLKKLNSFHPQRGGMRGGPGGPGGGPDGGNNQAGGPPDGGAGGPPPQN